MNFEEYLNEAIKYKYVVRQRKKKEKSNFDTSRKVSCGKRPNNR